MIDELQTGDARELARQIPDNSVDMVFTDPVYDRYDDYEWLAQEAARVLKPRGSLLAWCSNVDQYAVQPRMAEHMRFVLPLTYTKIAKAYKAFGYRTILWTTPILWFIKATGFSFEDHTGHDWLLDTVVDVERIRADTESNAVVTAVAPPRDTYKWHKNPEAYGYWLEKFTQPGDLVWDPFAGSGSLPVLCRQRGRHFIASEIQPDVAAQARERIAATPIPAPELLPVQTALFEETP